MLLPYVAAFFILIGSLATPRLSPEPRENLFLSDVLLVDFVTGVSVLIAAGFLMGLLDLLYPVLTAAIFLCVLYAGLYARPEMPRQVFQALADWALARNPDIDGPRKGYWRMLSILTRLIAMALIVDKTLSLAFCIDLNNIDVFQLYVSYFAEVGLRHGTSIDPMLPRFVDFIISRGNGAHLFLAAFMGPFSIQALGLLFLLVCCWIGRQMSLRMWPLKGEGGQWRRSRWVVCDAILVLSLASLNDDWYQPAKFHAQTGVLFLFLLWAVSLLIELDGVRRAALNRKLYLTFFALPISLIAYQAIATLILVLGSLRAVLEKKKRLLTAMGRFFATGALAVFVSSAVDWIYVGIPGIAPFQLFRRFIWPSVFGRWASEDVFVYTDLIQGFGLVRSSSRMQGHGLNHIVPPFLWWDFFHHALFQPLYLSLVLWVVGYFISRKGRKVLLGFSSSFYSLAAYLLAFLFLQRMTGSASLARLSIHLTFVALIVACGFIWGLITYPLQFYERFQPAWKSFSAPGLLCLGAMLTIANPTTLAAFLAFTILLRSIGWSGMIGLANNFVFARWYVFRWMAKWGVVVFLGKVVFLPTIVVSDSALMPTASPAMHRYFRKATEALLPPAMWYFLGRMSMPQVAEVDHPEVEDILVRCAEMAESLPKDGSSMIHLNYYLGMGSCVFSPVVPRGKIQHQYESIFARNFRALVLGDPEAAAVLYKKLAIDYFFVEKKDGEFWGAGCSQLFSEKNLPRYFDVQAENDHFVILTWKGRGRSPVTPGLAGQIAAWRNQRDIEPNSSVLYDVPYCAEPFDQYQEWARSH
jgi:hypothetical protein